MENVIPIFGKIMHDEPVPVFLDKVKNANLETAIVIGQDEGGVLFVGGNTGDFEKLVFLMLRANNNMSRIESMFPSLDDDLFE